ncbi:NAD-dependent epimerase/dehydratase family protein [Negadavirga shengliensis]|uniref:NAD-dependent epimerase/dehydratase family protein n=1 Tax=Negadavirga shengliensis TaxID=1389218 RepID=A0ABV9T555_9BACT
MDENIFSEIWKLSPKVKEREVYDKLVFLTEQLIALYDRQGRLLEDPFEPSRNRDLSLPGAKLNQHLKGSTCVVTGGLGCVGSRLVSELLAFSPESVIVLDKITPGESEYTLPDAAEIFYENCNILDERRLQEVFEKHAPDYVFHTAAQRNPGLAELEIHQTVKTNVLGTWNIINACEKSGSVKQCVFSSTGKASRYYTEEVYAATKKVCENMLDVFSREGRVKYGMVRFTHIVDNSLMNIQLRESARNDDYIAIHSPGKFVTAQNVKEAAYLMLNSLLYAEKGRCNFLLVKNLEWPVESLEVALYYLKQNKRKVPIIFSGNPKGYGEKFFRGQLDWNDPRGLNLLINVYENQVMSCNDDQDIIISHICPSSAFILKDLINELAKVEGEANAKHILLAGLRKMFVDSLEKVDKKHTLDILKWGIDPKFLAMEDVSVSDFGEMVPIMISSLKGTNYYKGVESLTNQIT